MSVKILHAADLHMDSPFDSLPPEKAALRRREQRELLSRIVRAANGENVQIALFSGDLFDSAASYFETGEALTRALADMRARVFIAPGNHDFWCERSPYSYLKFSDNVHIFTSPTIKCVELPELGCRVWGAGMNAPVCPPLLRGFSAGKSDMTDIMTLHGDMTGGAYGPVSEEDVAASGLDYLALGHVHAFSGIKKAGGTFYAYSGCPEGRGFDETGDKGVIIGTVGKGECGLRFLPMGGRGYRVLSADVTGAADVAGEVKKCLAPELGDDICRVVLTGEHAGRIDADALAEACGGLCFHLTVRDETRLPRDIWAAAGDDTLTGLFVSKMRGRYESAAPEERRGVELALRYGLAALENREEWRP